MTFRSDSSEIGSENEIDFLFDLKKLILYEEDLHIILDYIESHQYSLTQYQSREGLIYLNSLLSKSNGICGKRWNNDSITFKCKTCEKDPTCAICHDCFMNGDHEGHDYSLSQSGTGMCDCGDPEAWDRKGFCKHHKGPLRDASQHLPKELRRITFEVCYGYASLFFQKILSIYNISLDKNLQIEAEKHLIKHLKYFGELIDFITDKFQSYPCYKTLFGEALLLPFNDQFGDTSMIDIIYNRLIYLPPEFSDLACSLFEILVSDLMCKKIIGESFSKFYKEIICDALQSDDYVQYSHVTRISVQLFTTPPLAEHLVYNLNLLDTLFSILIKWLSDCLNPKTFKIDTDLYKSQTIGFYTVMSDFNYLLINPKISAYFLKRKDLIIQFLNILYCIHNSTQILRIDSDSDNWEYIYEIERKFSSSNYEHIDLGIKYLIEHEENYERILQENVFNIIFSYFYKIFETEFGNSGPEYITTSGIRHINFNMLNGPINYFFPIHKFFSKILRFILKYNPNFNIKSLLPNDNDFVLKLMENPLRIFPIISHVKRRLWPRDNMQISRQTAFYEKLYIDYTISNDIFLLQYLHEIVGSVTFLKTVENRFRRKVELFDIIHHKNQIDYGIEEDVLRFLLTLFTNRIFSWSYKECSKQFFLHSFFTFGKNSISSAIKYIPKPYKSSLNEEELMDLVFKNSSGTYECKKEAWKYFNPYFISYSQGNSESAIQNYHKVFGNVPVPLPELSPFPEYFSNTISLFHNQIIFQILFNNIFRIFQNVMKSLGIISDNLFIHTLHILYYALKTVDINTPMNDSDDIPNNIIQALKFPFLSNRMLTDDEDNSKETILSMLLKLNSHTDCKEHSPFIINFIFPLIQNHIDLPEINSSKKIKRKKSKSSKDTLAEKRRQKILDDMKKKQEKFNNESFLGENVILEEEETELCCFCHAPGTEENKLSLLAMITKSAACRIVYDQNIQDKYFNFCESDEIQIEDFPPKKKEDIQIQNNNNICQAHININLGDGTQINSCNHQCHSNCLQSYYISLLSEGNRNRRGSWLLDLDSSLEILCPICSSISNTRIPELNDKKLECKGIVSSQIIEEKIDLQFLIENILLYKNPSIQLSNDNRGDLTAFISEVKKLQGNSIDTVAYNLSTREIALRRNTTLILNNKEKELIYLVAKCVRASAFTSTEEDSNIIVKKICKTILGVSDFEDNIESLPLLSCDMFSLLTRLFILTDNLQDWNSYLTIVETLYISNFIQTLLILTQRFNVTNFPSDIQNLLKSFEINSRFNTGYNTNAQVNNIFQEIESLLLLFLRRTALLTTVFFSVNDFSNCDFNTLRLFFNLSDISSVINNITTQKNLNSLCNNWILQFERKFIKGNISKNILIPRFSAPTPFHFVRLPREFQPLFIKFLNSSCNVCKKAFKYPALSLINGEVVALDTCSCCESNEIGLAHHSKSQGDQGIYLSFRDSIIIVIATSRFALVNSIYKDKYGEIDEGLYRGIPLYLDQSVLLGLEQKFILNQFEQDSLLMVNPDARSGRINDLFRIKRL